ncbi:hypothetical protein GCM10027169_25160 [Gordonia jinhuaensis]|uniref:Lumazine-binding domain n=2 Tax=Gordonia jinhuaensis TaxID=1517702 RepID=A0A916TDE4_9ACTN|nr:hypothetical protein GCM10011489_28760 [Gordonia jinhuaensis]
MAGVKRAHGPRGGPVAPLTRLRLMAKSSRKPSGAREQGSASRQQPARDQKPPRDQKQVAAEPEAVDESTSGLRAIWPFLVALGIVVLLFAIWGIAQLVNPSDERMGTNDKIAAAVNDHYTAQNSGNYDKFRATTCSAVLGAADFPTESAFDADHDRDSREHGKIQIDSIDDIAVDGSTATATLRWTWEKSGDDKQSTPIRLQQESDTWKVCGKP